MNSFSICMIQVNNYEIVVNFFHISHNLTWYSAIVHKFTNLWTDNTIHVNLCNKIAQSISKRITCISPCDLYKMTLVLAWCITPWMVGILIHLWNGWREVGRWSPFIRPIVLWGHRGRARPRRRWGNSWACRGTVGPNVKNPPKIRIT